MSSSTGRYRRIAFEPTTVAGQPGYRWVFEQPESGSIERRVDYFFRLGADGYAVLGNGPDYATAESVARQIADSIVAS